MVTRHASFVLCCLIACACMLSPAGMASAADVLMEKQISLELAREAAAGALAQCRKDNYRVTVTVLDRAGTIKAVLRDDTAPPHTVDTSSRKAYTAANFRVSTTEFAKRLASNPAAANLKDIEGVIVLSGGLPIVAGAEVIGAIGVAGAPGGDKDEVCAQAGISKIADKLK